MNIKPESKVYWILNNVMPGGWGYPSNFCQLFRQFVGFSLVVILLTLIAVTELGVMGLTMVSMFMDTTTVVVDGKEIVRLYIHMLLGPGIGGIAMTFGIVGWLIVCVVIVIFTFWAIVESPWIKSIRTAVNRWRYGLKDDRSLRQAARKVVTSGFWYYVRVYFDSAHRKICPLITYNDDDTVETVEDSDDE